MKKVLQNLVAHIIKVAKSLALSYLLVQVLTNRFPQVLTWLNGVVASGNSWFASIGGWAASAVNWVAGVLAVIYGWLPLLGHAVLLALAWRVLTFLVDVLNAKTSPSPRHRAP